MEELWKNCFEDYEISNFGNCRRKLKNGNTISVKGCIGNRGYRYFQVIRNGKRYNKLFHQLVAEQFISERPENMVIDHIDRNSLNNHISNLRYISQKDNTRNSDRVVTEIPFDIPDRKKLLDKRYVELNRESVLQNKRDYYQKNKTELLKKQSEDKVEVICEKCNKPRTITRQNYNRGKRLGVNTCKICSSIINLEHTR